jgi:hypothetical protein
MARGQTPDIGRNGQTPAPVAEKFAPSAATPSAQTAPSGVRPRTLAVSDGYFLDLMKAIRAFAFAIETEPGGMVALMTPFGKPFTICASGLRIDSSR